MSRRTWSGFRSRAMVFMSWSPKRTTTRSRWSFTIIDADGDLKVEGSPSNHALQVKGSASKMVSTRYSWRSRYCSTSNWRRPTAAIRASWSLRLRMICTVPSCAIWDRPLSNALRLPTSVGRRRANISGWNCGSGLKLKPPVKDTVSPMAKTPGLMIPMISPG